MRKNHISRRIHEVFEIYPANQNQKPPKSGRKRDLPPGFGMFIAVIFVIAFWLLVIAVWALGALNILSFGVCVFAAVVGVIVACFAFSLMD